MCDEKSKGTEDAKLRSLHAIHNIVSKKLSYCKHRFKSNFRFEPAENPGRSRKIKDGFPEDWIGPFPTKKTRATEVASRILDSTTIRSITLVQEMEMITTGTPEQVLEETICRSARGRIPN